MATKKVTKKTEKEIAKTSKSQNNPFLAKGQRELENEYAIGFNEGATATYETLDRDPEFESLWSEYYANKEKLRDEKFGSNPFAKKYKNHLGFGMSENFVLDDALESAEQVKSWSKHERARTLLEATNIFLAIIVGIGIGILIANL